MINDAGPDPTDQTDPTEDFEQHRTRLRSIAFRMLSSHSDADDAVQDTWLRLQRTDPATIDNLGGWLTVVISRICLDQLRRRGSHQEDPVAEPPEDDLSSEPPGPEDESVQADAVGAALVMVLDTLTPAERLAFVLHDLFGLPFDEVAPIVDRSPAATRQLASRARRRLRGSAPTGARSRQREVVSAFLAASREGDFGRLLRLLDPDVELRADARTVAAAAPYADRGAPLLAERLHGPDAVARVFAGRAAGAQPALINGIPGAVWAPGGQVRTAFAMHVRDGHIVGIEVIGDASQIADLDIVIEQVAN